MKGKSAVLGLIVTLCICSSAFGFDGNRVRGHGPRISQDRLLAQLPPEKEMLFHQAMREVKDKAAAVRGQIKDLRREIKEAFLANPFDEGVYRKKKTELEALQAQKRDDMDAAVVGLAKQFSPEERQILTQLVPRQFGFDRLKRKGRRP